MRVQFITGLALIAATLSGCDSNSVPVEGTVISMTYKCRFDISSDDPTAERIKNGERPAETDLTGDCSQDPDFLAARADFAGSKVRLKGKATAQVAFVSPVDNTSVEGELEFDGDDRGFYELQNNAPVRLMVDKTDHSRIRFAG